MTDDGPIIGFGVMGVNARTGDSSLSAALPTAYAAAFLWRRARVKRGRTPLQPQIALDALRLANLLRLWRGHPLHSFRTRRYVHSGPRRIIARLRALASNRFERRDPLAGAGFQLLLQRRPVVGDEIGLVPRAADLDVEALRVVRW